MKRRSMLLGILVLGIALGTTAQVPQPSAAPKEPSPPDPCSLLSAEEIQSVQGTEVRKERRSQTPSGTMVTLQCFYEAVDFGKSVSLALVVPNEKMRSSARLFWMERFHPKALQTHKSAEGAQGALPSEVPKKKLPPRAIPGLGEEAYWVGNNLAGSLYVLEDEHFLRISVGGPGDESARIERSTTLARYALKRLGDAARLPQQP